MAEAASLSDDSSEASSGDEMLNIVVPFSQQSAADSPYKVSAKSSESEASSGGKMDAQTAARAPSKKRSREELESTGADGDLEANARADATKAFRVAYGNGKIGAPDKLFWLERTKKRAKVLCPVRIVPRDETCGLALREPNDKEVVIEFIQLNGADGDKVDVVSRRGLSSYHGGGDDSRWCRTKFEQYSKQLKRTKRPNQTLDLKAEEIFLELVLQKSMEEGKVEQELSQMDEALPGEIFKVESVDRHVESEEEEDEPEVRGARNASKYSDKKETLRVGDKIEYYSQMSVTGDKRGKRVSTILSIDPKSDHMITIDDMTQLDSEHSVKRIKRKERGKLVDHPGRWLHISDYVLKKEGPPDAYSKWLAGEMARMGKIRQNTVNAIEAFHQKES
ncbi:hypothetical protein ACHAWF_011543 [Thalassiosira exigua]